MKLYEVKEILDAEVLSGEDKLDQEFWCLWCRFDE